MPPTRKPYGKIVSKYFDEPADVIIASDSRVLRWTGGVLAVAVSPLGYLSIPFLGVLTAQAAKALF